MNKKSEGFLSFLRQLFLWVALIAVAAVSIWWYLQQEQSADPWIPPSPTETTGPYPTTPTAEPSDPNIPGIPSHAQMAEVDSIHDGDTLRLIALEPGQHITESNSVRVRLIGIDTPEVTEPKECFADEATRALIRLAPIYSTVWVSIDNEAEDHYGRKLLYLWNEQGQFINYELVASGHAEAIRVRPNDSHWDLLRETERQAYNQNLGMWGSC